MDMFLKFKYLWIITIYSFVVFWGLLENIFLDQNYQKLANLIAHSKN